MDLRTSEMDETGLRHCSAEGCHVWLNAEYDDWTYPIPLRTKKHGDLYLCPAHFVEFRREAGDKRNEFEILGWR